MQAEPTVVQKKGGLTKCPSCNAPVVAGSTACPSCLHEFGDVDANRSVKGLAGRLDQIDHDVQQLGTGLSRRKEEARERKRNAIRNFPIPNAREDLLELIHFIHPRTRDGIDPDLNREDWRVKFVEVMSRARAAYAGDTGRLAEFQRLEQGLETGVSEGLVHKARRNPIFVALLLAAATLGAFAWFNARQEEAKLAKCQADYGVAAQGERERLEQLHSAITRELQARHFPEAMAATTRMRWEPSAGGCLADENQKAVALWNDKKTQLVGLIQQGSDAAAAEKKAQAEQETAAKLAEQDKEAQVARIAREREQAAAAQAAARAQAAAAKAATEQRKAATEKLF
jgi:hypothetical protein